MINSIFANTVLIQGILITAGLAFSQYIVLRCGVFSVATVAFADIGAYTAGILSTRQHADLAECLVAGIVMSMIAGGIVSIAIRQARGIYQAIITFAFVLILQSVLTDGGTLTGGAQGLIAIPQLGNLWELLIFVLLTLVLLIWMGHTTVGRSIDAVRQDESAALATGIRVDRQYAFVVILSAVIAGAAGVFSALLQFSVNPDTFDFTVLVNVVAAVVIGGATSPVGALVGSLIVGLLPQISQGVAGYAQAVDGALMLAVILLLPRGLVPGIRSMTEMLIRQIREYLAETGLTGQGRGGAVADASVRGDDI